MQLFKFFEGCALKEEQKSQHFVSILQYCVSLTGDTCFSNKVKGGKNNILKKPPGATSACATIAVTKCWWWITGVGAIGTKSDCFHFSYFVKSDREHLFCA